MASNLGLLWTDVRARTEYNYGFFSQQGNIVDIAFSMPNGITQGDLTLYSGYRALWDVAYDMQQRGDIDQGADYLAKYVSALLKLQIGKGNMEDGLERIIFTGFLLSSIERQLETQH